VKTTEAAASVASNVATAMVYIGHDRLGFCVSVCPLPHSHTHGPGCNLGEW